MFRRIVMFCMFCIVLSVAAAEEDPRAIFTPRFRDLTESGTALEFRETRTSEVTLYFLEDPTTHRPVFEVRGRPGDQVEIACSGLAPGWTARAWTGPGVWRSLPIHASLTGQEILLDFQHSRELVELFPPGISPSRTSDYSYSDFIDYMNGLPSDPRLTVSVLGNSVQGRPVYKVLFDDLGARMPAIMKRTVVVIIRQHGDEWPSSFIFEGMLDYLLGVGGWQPDPEVTEQVRWIIYPMVNPDGVVLNQRYNASGVDLNRNWSAEGPQAWQEPEVFLVQNDLANLPYQNSFRVFGDHHGWWSDPDGGFRYDDSGDPAHVTHAAYLEDVKDTDRYTEYEPMVWDWYENGGQDGMSRVELYHWKGWIGHTPEYYTGTRDEDELRTAGARYMQAMHNTSYALAITSPTVQIGQAVPLFVDEDDQNLDPFVAETISMLVGDWVTRDLEYTSLVETGLNTGELISTSLFTGSGPQQNYDGVLQTVPGSYVVGYYRDPDLRNDRSFAGARIVP